MPRKIYTPKDMPDFSIDNNRMDYMFILNHIYKTYLRDNEWFTKTSASNQETFCILVWLSENT